MFEPEPTASVDAEDTVGQLLHSLGVGLGVPIDNSLKNHPALVRALEFALRPNPDVEDGNDMAAGAAALSVIIGCARQEKRPQEDRPFCRHEAWQRRGQDHEPDGVWCGRT
jgi:hypothetical protein